MILNSSQVNQSVDLGGWAARPRSTEQWTLTDDAGLESDENKQRPCYCCCCLSTIKPSQSILAFLFKAYRLPGDLDLKRMAVKFEEDHAGYIQKISETWSAA